MQELPQALPLRQSLQQAAFQKISGPLSSFSLMLGDCAEKTSKPVAGYKRKCKILLNRSYAHVPNHLMTDNFGYCFVSIGQTVKDWYLAISKLNELKAAKLRNDALIARRESEETLFKNGPVYTEELAALRRANAQIERRIIKITGA